LGGLSADTRTGAGALFCQPGSLPTPELYSYEGTREMNTLIVGKSITGLSAFV
jgi:hypothetical protein